MPFNVKQALIAVWLLLIGVCLSAASMEPGLPDNYWDQPKANLGHMPHGWSALETNLHPEACAQCHIEQFNAWKHSLHAHAYSSGMIGQFPEMGVEDSNDCLKCHAPLRIQQYGNTADLMKSLDRMLVHPEGFNHSAELVRPLLPLRHSGVSCAVCHVRGLHRYGPPPTRSGSVGMVHSVAHGGFTATRQFEQSEFCASCHQFPDAMAIHGKPLENTLNEWKQSKFPKLGMTCQTCHMPDRRHEFRGIHDKEMVKKGLSFALSKGDHRAVLSITSRWIGHAFPTYVTPKVVVQALAMDSHATILKRWEWSIVREVNYDGGWQELRDTRLLPGERREFIAQPLPAHTTQVRYTIHVMPDHFYKGVYSALLADSVETGASPARTHLHHALERAVHDDYLLYENTIDIVDD